MNLLYEISNAITGTKLWSWITKNFFAQFDVRILGDSKFPMEKWYDVENICKENSDKLLVFVSYGTKLSSILVKLIARSRWTHAGIIRVIDGKVRIVHMESKGLLDQVLLELLKSIDNFAIIEIPMKPEEKHLAYMIMNKYIEQHPGYDFQMLLGNKALYCSELIYEMCRYLPVVKTHEEAGRKVFEPEDVYKLGNVLFEC